MTACRLALVAMAWLGLVALAGARDEKEEKELQKKLTGRWEASKGKGLPPGSVLDLKKDGKMSITISFGDKEVSLDGTWKVKGKAFVMTVKRGEKEKTQTIKVTKVSDKELVVEGEGGADDALTFKRAEEKKKKKKTDD